MKSEDLPTPLLQVCDLHKTYKLARRQLWQPAPQIQALQGINLELLAGRSLGIVGESGCGKSTLGRLVMALDTPTAGEVLLNGQNLHTLSGTALRAARRDFQMVFQDPYGSLNPRMTVGRSVAEPLQALVGAEKISTAEQRERAAEALVQVGLHAADVDKYPHEFSGGQRQRVAIARALITRPKLIVADEPVSALDVSIQAQVLNLLLELQQQFGISYLLISHDLAVVSHLCDEILVLYQGKMVERGTPRQLLHAPCAPYTRALLEAVPQIDPGATRVRRRNRRPPPTSAMGDIAL